MKIRRLILLGMVFLGVVGMTACKPVDTTDNTNQSGDNGGGQGGSGENQGGSGENQGGSGENQGGSGENQGGSGENQGGSGENQGGSGENQGGSGENQGGSGENQGGSGENQGGSGENQGGSGENQGGSGGQGNDNSGLITTYGPLNPKYASSAGSSDGGSVNLETLGASAYVVDDEDDQGTLTSGSGNVVMSGEVKVTNCSGGYEGAYIEFNEADKATSYNVYVKKTSSDSYTKLDEKNLYISSNGTKKYRADILGLSKGTYDFKIVAVQNSKESTEVATTGILNVAEYDRSGYAHFNYDEGVGAYNNDGTLKENAIVLYVTDTNKNSVTLTYKGKTVSGIGNILNTVGKGCGEAGHETQCKKVNDSGKAFYAEGNTNQGILADLANDNIPLVVRFVGIVSESGLYAPGTYNAKDDGLIDGLTAYANTKDTVNLDGTLAKDNNNLADYGGTAGDNGHMARMKSAKNVTIEGVGDNAGLDGWGIHFMSESANPSAGKSFEVRNLVFMNTPEDAIGMEGVATSSKITAGVERCWVHHNTFLAPSISNPAESDKGEGDGSCDFKRGQYFTLSYNYFEGCHKTNLIGSSDSSLQFNISFHHNLWYNCGSRIPLLRQANIHFYNNYVYGDITDKSAGLSYVSSIRANAYLFTEANYYEGCKNTFEMKSGTVKSYGNSFVECFGSLSGSGITFASDREESVTAACSYNGTSFQNFDTNTTLFYYDSTNKVSDCYLTSAYVAKQECIKFAGSQYRTVLNKAKMSTATVANKTTPTKAIDLSSGSFTAALASAKGSSEKNGIYYTNVSGYTSNDFKFKDQGITFKLTESATITIAITGPNGIYAGQVVRSDGKLMLSGSGTAVLTPGIYYVCSCAMDKESTVSALSFEKYDSAAYSGKIKAFAQELYNAIPETITGTVECYNAVVKAINAYNSVLETERTGLTDPTSKLAEVVNLYKAYAEGEINKIGTVTEDSLELINAAQYAVNVLTAMDKTVTPSNLSTLTAAINTYQTFAVTKAIAAINAIGEVDLTEAKKTLIENALVAYDILSDEQAEQVTNYAILTAAVEAYNTQYNFALVNNSIVEVELDDPVAIKEAVNLYNSLNASQKEELECKDKVVQIQIQYVINLINSIGEVELSDIDIVNAAKEVYSVLNDEQKALVTNYSLLATIEETLSELATATHIKTFDDGITDKDGFFTFSSTNLDNKDFPAKTYAGTTYTTAIKMEKSTSIKFTTTKTQTLTIVTSKATAKINIDGTDKKTDADGILVIELEAGSHEVKKGDSMDVFAFIIS